MSKQVQIPMELFLDICLYFKEHWSDSYQTEDIKRQLDDKLDKMISHLLFSKYKRAATPEEREQARREYLEHRGTLPSFISDTEFRAPD